MVKGDGVLNIEILGKIMAQIHIFHYMYDILSFGSVPLYEICKCDTQSMTKGKMDISCNTIFSCLDSHL